ncbi:hypothetical protein BBJ28_00001848 [Nothophytophthora sp. Chile5]|nr:hypothetical protein BBJ28_00001848 [Nothophytophthora sp. Chile5]
MEAKKLPWLEDDDEVQRMLPPTSASLPKSIEKPLQAGPVLVKALASYPAPAPPKVYPETTTNYTGNGRSRNPTAVSAWSSTDRRPSAKPPSVLLQLVLAVVVAVCLAWTIWLILLTVAPNTMVNRIMNTQSFDNGSFWLFVYPSSSVLLLAVIGLSAKIWMKIGDLVIETVLLIQILEAGSPAVLVAVFTVIIASNALVCAIVMFLPYERMGLAEILVDLLYGFIFVFLRFNLLVSCLFDLLIAVGCPMIVLFYCLSTFSFDREKLAINLEVFPAGWFEQQASVIADPIQTAVIYKSLKSLRIASILDFITRVGVNITLWLRLRHVLELVQDSKKQQDCVYPKRHRKAAVFFVTFAALLVIFVEESMRTSTLACQPHPECAVNARRWTFLDAGSMTQCPCLMLIDRDVAPKSYSEWQQPRNVTEKVAQLATLGELQTVQLTNRYLPVLPEELARCTGMKHFHLESKFTSPMVVLPDDMFDDMESLTFIHFAAFIPMAQLPSFQGLTNLKSLTLAVFLSLVELPDFSSLRNLERLLITCTPVIDSLPDLAPLTKLKSLTLTDRGTWCCNGFLGNCDLQSPM